MIATPRRAPRAGYYSTLICVMLLCTGVLLCSSAPAEPRDRNAHLWQTDEAVRAAVLPGSDQQRRRAMVALHANAAKAIEQLLTMQNDARYHDEAVQLLDQLARQVNRRDWR